MANSSFLYFVQILYHSTISCKLLQYSRDITASSSKSCCGGKELNRVAKYVVDSSVDSNTYFHIWILVLRLWRLCSFILYIVAIFAIRVRDL